MPSTADFRAFVLDRIDQLDRLYDSADPHLIEESAAVYAAAASEAGNMAAYLGLAELHRRSQDFGAYAEWPAVKTFLSECLAAIPEAPAPATNSPYLDSRAAADYLGITVKSLYGLVELGQLVPLRGPKRSYRFTTKILDSYVLRTG